VLKRSATARAVTRHVAEPGIDQPSLQARLLRHWRASFGRGVERVPGRPIVMCGQQSLGERGCGIRPGRWMDAPGRGHRGLDVSSRRASPRFEQREHVFEPVRRRPALSCAADELRSSRCAAFGQAAPRCDQAGHRADQLVRVNPQSGVGQPQLDMRSLYLVAVQVHRCERDTRSRGVVLRMPVTAVLGGLDRFFR
jgi:hypothetical protein